MNKYEVVWTSDALNDLDEVYEFIAQKSIQRAIKTVEAILDQADQLITHPYSGQKEEGLQHLSDNYRYLVKDHYKTIYQVLEQRVVIIQVFDTRQDPSKMKG